MKSGKLSGGQLRLLIIGSVTVMGHLLIVPLVFDQAGRDSWLSWVIAIAVGFILAWSLIGLGTIAPEKSMIQISSQLFGNILGGFVGLTMTLFFITTVAITLRGLMSFMGTVFFPQTPSWVLGLFFLAACVYTAAAGLQNLARANAILLPFLITAGILAWAFTTPDKDYQLILPFLERGISPVIQGALPLVGLLGELVVVGMLQPFLKKGTTLYKTHLTAVLVIGLLFIGPLTGPIAMFGETAAARMDYPTFAEFKFSVLMVNFQSLAVFLWLGGSFGRISLYYYAATLSCSQALGIKNYKILLLPVGLMSFAMAQWLFPDLQAVKNFLIYLYFPVSVILGVIFPMLLLILLYIKKYIQGRHLLKEA
ncbi:GerAB/ArcD/ProY family transporter [Desulforamulus aquiferis]|uniref:Endospore germination permease n=1 Tax=Desulforamulus aquiferis TaxID=1397668 RepID=A0AAW7ZFE8_9FIRM|nr:endospore germination permease [Desulforamulus aquiferis]MDO7788118.1 endospore germination permease [Desulforamulus aquiferis]